MEAGATQAGRRRSTGKRLRTNLQVSCAAAGIARCAARWSTTWTTFCSTPTRRWSRRPAAVITATTTVWFVLSRALPTRNRFLRISTSISSSRPSTTTTSSRSSKTTRWCWTRRQRRLMRWTTAAVTRWTATKRQRMLSKVSTRNRFRSSSRSSNRSGRKRSWVGWRSWTTCAKCWVETPTRTRATAWRRTQASHRRCDRSPARTQRTEGKVGESFGNFLFNRNFILVSPGSRNRLSTIGRWATAATFTHSGRRRRLRRASTWNWRQPRSSSTRSSRRTSRRRSWYREMEAFRSTDPRRRRAPTATATTRNTPSSATSAATNLLFQPQSSVSSVASEESKWLINWRWLWWCKSPY